MFHGQEETHKITSLVAIPSVTSIDKKKQCKKPIVVEIIPLDDDVDDEVHVNPKGVDKEAHENIEDKNVDVAMCRSDNFFFCFFCFYFFCMSSTLVQLLYILKSHV